MIDGVKVDCINLNGAEWLNNKYLSFRTNIDTTTGEILSNTQTAVYKGLIFSLTQSNKPGRRFYCSFRGSLHKYKNAGKDNADNFCHSDFIDVLKDLQNKFSLDLNQCFLRNLEIGVNIETPVNAKDFINNIIGTPAHPLEYLFNEKTGKCKGLTKQQYSIKIYDKGKQAKTDKTNLVRYEMKIKKMAYLLRFGVTTLIDLTDINRFAGLGSLLVNQWENMIYFNKDIRYKEMTDYQQKRILYLANSRNWKDFNKTQRIRAKGQFKRLVNAFGYGNPEHTQTAEIIAKKIQQLTGEKCTPFNHDFRQTDSKEMYTFYPLECRDKKCTHHKKKQSLKFLPKMTPKNKRFCRVCHSDISHKKSGAVYCSKSCNNKINGHRRTERHRKQNAKEKPILNKLLRILPVNKLFLSVSYKTESGIYTDFLGQTEISAPPNLISRITEIQAEPIRKNGHRHTLTGTRAKKLIRQITKLNFIHYEHKKQSIYQITKP